MGSWAFLIVVTAASGYLFSALCYIFKFKIVRDSGYRLYLHCFATGLCILVTAYVITNFTYFLTDLFAIPSYVTLDQSEESNVGICI